MKVVSIINNTGVFFEIVGMVIFAIVMLIVHRHQPISVVTNSGGLHVGFGSFFVAMFMSLFVIYGMDTASTLAEETNDPRASAQAVLSSVGGAFVIGGIFLLAALMAIPNLSTPSRTAGDPRRSSSRILQAVRDHLSRRGVGRDPGLLPRIMTRRSVCASAWRATTVCRYHRPFQRAPASCTRRSSRASSSRSWPRSRCSSTRAPAYVAIAATGMIYLAYLLGNIAVMKARMGGWPNEYALLARGMGGSSTCWLSSTGGRCS